MIMGLFIMKMIDLIKVQGILKQESIYIDVKRQYNSFSKSISKHFIYFQMKNVFRNIYQSRKTTQILIYEFLNVRNVDLLNRISNGRPLIENYQLQIYNNNTFYSNQLTCFNNKSALIYKIKLIVISHDYIVIQIEFRQRRETIIKLVRFTIYSWNVIEIGVLRIIQVKQRFLNLIKLKIKIFQLWHEYLLIAHILILLKIINISNNSDCLFLFQYTIIIM
ncbi:unnamed protein product (macronuclear) [Paramecium tetraurelia]|uniref:Transmembrane protein n=1 Tax=Paramecium tetraurelia TaxID=5888 RepID=A0DBP7_PARTE|nr:uncharacterized protein GSPATT00015361001 [Paramecium tetraurelia]CAK80464.1 unnamed protein product [Paramecium tetraurelia]|eukprot:XP_001447861.1 hypothetical protein (macronuclear) [Paramecium tetraurelia strain d4-2]